MDLFCLSAEISGVAMIIARLGNQLDNNETDILNPEAMRNALYGVQTHLERRGFGRIRERKGRADK